MARSSVICVPALHLLSAVYCRHIGVSVPVENNFSYVLRNSEELGERWGRWFCGLIMAVVSLTYAEFS